MTLSAEAGRTPLNAQDVALAAANGSGTLTRQIRVSRPGPDASISTLLSGGEQRPPAWVEKLVQEELPSADDLGHIKLDTLVRFARACAVLPARTPKPYFNVGDDATIGAEWDLGRYHVEIQVGNNSAVDSIVLEVDKGEPDEIPLAGNLGVLASIMSQIVNG
ncbi:MAG: hypothetical protein LC775_02930 [Acidobacteria bacterium]|nr:hypothetical protein [Acidobacteriota bacterium]